MIEFLNERVRAEFHLLPLDRQKGIKDAADNFFDRGFVTTVLCVENLSPSSSEIAIRIDKKFDFGNP